MTDRIGWHMWDDDDNWVAAPPVDTKQVTDPYGDDVGTLPTQPPATANPHPTIRTAPKRHPAVPVWGWWAAVIVLLAGIIAGLLYTTVVDNGPRQAPATVSPLPQPADGAQNDAPADLPTAPRQNPGQ